MSNISWYSIMGVYIGIFFHVFFQMSEEYSKSGYSFAKFISIRIVDILAVCTTIPAVLLAISINLQSKLPLNLVTCFLVGYTYHSVMVHIVTIITRLFNKPHRF